LVTDVCDLHSDIGEFHCLPCRFILKTSKKKKFN
jgi:hypothetical protein